MFISHKSLLNEDYKMTTVHMKVTSQSITYESKKTISQDYTKLWKISF